MYLDPNNHLRQPPQRDPAGNQLVTNQTPTRDQCFYDKSFMPYQCYNHLNPTTPQNLFCPRPYPSHQPQFQGQYFPNKDVPSYASTPLRNGMNQNNCHNSAGGCNQKHTTMNQGQPNTDLLQVAFEYLKSGRFAKQKNNNEKLYQTISTWQ